MGLNWTVTSFWFFLLFFGRDLQQFALQLGNEIRRTKWRSQLFYTWILNRPHYKRQISMQHNIATQLQTSASLPSEALQECQWEVHAAPNRTDVPCNTWMEGSAYISYLLITKIFSCPGANRPFSCKYASVVAHSTCGTANSVSLDILLAGPAAAAMQCHEISRIGNGWHGPKPSIGCHIPSHDVTRHHWISAAILHTSSASCIPRIRTYQNPGQLKSALGDWYRSPPEHLIFGSSMIFLHIV